MFEAFLFLFFFFLPLYFIEIRFVKSVLISTLLFLTNLFLVSAKNSLVVVNFSNIESLNDFRMDFFMIIIHMRFDYSQLFMSLLSSTVLLSVRGRGVLTLNAKSRSMIVKNIKRFSCHYLKLEPFSITIRLMLAIILVADITE